MVELGLEDLPVDVRAGRQRDALIAGDAHARNSAGDRLAHERAGAGAADAAEQRLLGEAVDERAQARGGRRARRPAGSAQARTSSATSSTHPR